MGLTNEQKGEIRAAYRDAANPKKQITILAQLYTTSKEEICKVLGIEAPEQKPKKTLRSYEQAVKDDVVKAVLLEGATYQEAAERFGVPYGNVNAWVNKARKKQAEFGVAAPPPSAWRRTAATAPQPLPAHCRQMLQSAKDGAAGLRRFLDAYWSTELLSSEDEQALERLLTAAVGFVNGLEAGLCAAEREGSHARDSQGPRTTA